MVLSNFFKENLIILDLKAKDKNNAINEIIELISKNKQINKEEVKVSILEREKMQSTGIGNGIALPHARITSIKNIIIAFAKSNEGIDFNSIDNKFVNIFFMIIGNPEKHNEYLEIISKLARILSKKENRQSILDTASPKKIIDLIDKIDKKEI
ncbi:MAG: PTS sugar transporter subunit IIA [bacterium]